MPILAIAILQHSHSEAVPSDLDEQLISQWSHSSLSLRFSSLDPPNGFDPAGKWPAAVSSLELIRRRGTAASTAPAACGSGRYRPEAAAGKTTLCLVYLGSSSATWNPFSRVLVLWLSGTLRWFIIICFLFVLFPTKENK